MATPGDPRQRPLQVRQFFVSAGALTRPRHEWAGAGQAGRGRGYARPFWWVTTTRRLHSLHRSAWRWRQSVTTTLRLGSCVYCNDFRHPALLAKEAAELDRLSEGRFELGLGAGWIKEEYDAIGLLLRRRQECGPTGSRRRWASSAGCWPGRPSRTAVTTTPSTTTQRRPRCRFSTRCRCSSAGAAPRMTRFAGPARRHHRVRPHVFACVAARTSASSGWARLRRQSWRCSRAPAPAAPTAGPERSILLFDVARRISRSVPDGRAGWILQQRQRTRRYALVGDPVGDGGHPLGATRALGA